MAPRHLCLLLLAVSALCLATAAQITDVPNVETNAKGHSFITTADGQKWVVLGKEGQRFFLNEGSKAIVYQDPRVAAPLEPKPKTEADVEGAIKDEATGGYHIMHKGAKWSVHRDAKSDRFYFHNAATQHTTWDDPRLPSPEFEDPAAPRRRTKPQPPKGAPPKAPLSPSEKLRVSLVAAIPVILFLGVLGARIYYLHTHYPELLFPTKERKERRRSGGKFKPQKARGKMSQDGKGGRSANS